MVLYYCNKCNKEFNNLSNYNKHINKIRPLMVFKTLKNSENL